MTTSGELKGPSGRLSASGSRELTAGRGRTLRFVNTASGADFEVAALTGHNVLILFPTDVPAGPSTTLYVGQVVISRMLRATSRF